MADLPDGFFNLKHRLVGATVLILIAVILLPRVLTGTDAGSTRSSANARALPDVQPQALAEVLPSDSVPAEDSTRTRIEILEQPAVPQTVDGTGNAESSDYRSADRKKEGISEMQVLSDPSVSKSIVTGFIVQVGIFQRPENVSNLILSLKKDDIDAKLETIEIDGRRVTRIWLGPFSTRSEAIREGNKAMMRTQSKPIVKEWP